MAILLSSKLHRYPNRSSVKYAPVIRARRYAFKKLIAKRTSSSYCCTASFLDQYVIFYLSLSFHGKLAVMVFSFFFLFLPEY